MVMEYVSRCKYGANSKNSNERFNRIHGAIDGRSTLCNKELNEMWFFESNYRMSVDNITCPKCKKVIKEKNLS